jgi:ABC-type lipoprotein release transport system permease subunit
MDSKSLAWRMLLTLAWRNLWRNQKRTVVTLSSIAIGFGLCVFFIGIGDGSHNSMIRNAIKLGEGHLTLQTQGYLAAPANHKYIADSQPVNAALQAAHLKEQSHARVSLQVLASTANNSVGAGFEGIESREDPRIEELGKHLTTGTTDIFADPRSVLIGHKLANKLKVRVGGKIVLMAGKSGGDSQAQLARVKGIYDSGLTEIDSYLVLGNIELGRLFLQGEGADSSKAPITRMAIFLEDPDQTSSSKQQLSIAMNQQDRLAETIELWDWQEMMPQLVQFIVLDDAGNYVFLGIILIMVVIGIVNTVLMSVLERTREFGLLRALGVNRQYLLSLVFCETILLSVLAVLAGWLVGGSVHFWFAEHGLDFGSFIGDTNTEMAGTHMDKIIYTELSWNRVFQLTSIIFGTTIITGIYPAIKAARVTPVAALHT